MAQQQQFVATTAWLEHAVECKNVAERVGVRFEAEFSIASRMQTQASAVDLKPEWLNMSDVVTEDSQDSQEAMCNTRQ